MLYNWQQSDWPVFRHDVAGIQDTLLALAERAGRVAGAIGALSPDLQAEATLHWLVTEAIKTSEIEGEYLSRQDVMSSIRNNLGLNSPPERIADDRARGIAEVMVDVRNSFAETLTREKLFTWHRMLLESQAVARRISVGQWRTDGGPMQVVSGRQDRPTVHFEAPPSSNVSRLMDQFIHWFNDSAPNGKHPLTLGPVRAALSHLYFESIHPFDDGNGRIGRVVTEKALAQSWGRPVLMSLSQAMEAKKRAYYTALEKAQKSHEVTDWIAYFVQTLLEAQIAAEEQVNFVLAKVRFFDQHREQLNDRQTKVIKRMLQEGPQGFEGGMSARKYIGLTGASKATATRDLQHLASLGIFRPIGSGRSSHYELIIGNV